MAEPVVNHELQPSRGQQIQEWYLKEFAIPREQLFAYFARIRREKLFVVRNGSLQGQVATKSGATSTHLGMIQVIETTVFRSRASLTFGV